MLYQLSYEVKSVRMCDIVQLQFDICMYTAISIKVVPKKKEKVEYMSAKGLSGKTIVLFPNTLPFIGFPLSLKLDLAFL